ncbi:replicative DNA helicase [Campylobacter upsaliensis]|uniref:Replicative DNA helicase n=1 Tax=Campylobacter upsaliensis TaxID=28080 RepID=A0A5L8S6B4_CAMUP|nr:replicative DNA helicase [Campylobacter upsaliensis]EAH5552931.1 replicative DNA helicase [Campylobacter upsaliensis]EAH5676608.1 replicative DNA helicase [Campylobacter upsaliensis]EAH6025611.1 replicative DNA helicase [Campylobacter upsaliensis]EAH6029182.1 replicative DNA helicase [Campylobacter upsaliensis]EAH6236670.1 replicative DNA helicase [Campylobacter upsaliensis]
MNNEEHYDLDLERMILSSCLLGGGEVYANIAGDIEIKDFSLKAHQDIFKAIVSCVNAGEPIGLSFLKKYGKLDEQILNEIIATPSMINISAYAKELREKSIKRQLLSFAHLLPSRISANRAVSEISDELSKDIFTIISRVNSADIKNVNEVLGELLEEFKRQKSLENKHIIGLESGFSELDDKTKGFKGGELIIVAARPGMGKTTLCLNFIDNVLRQNKGVVMFSLEMPGIQIMQRLLASKTSIPLQKIITADLNDDEWDRVSDACNYYAKTQFFLYDSGYASITDIRAILRRLKAQEDDISLCVVDYIGLMMSHSNFSDRHLQVSEISRGLKLLARELDMPIIALSQLNRSLENRSNKRPMLSDLRESGAIEQDADTILFVYRDEVYREQEEKERENKAKAEGKEYHPNFMPNPRQENAEIIIGKNRNGPVGTTEVEFQKENSRFVDKPSGMIETTFNG